MEMFGMIGGLAGAGLGFAGAMENAEAQEDTNRLNWAINIMNMQQRERERSEAIAMALRQRREWQEGSTNILGVRTHYVPGRGWVVDSTPQVDAMVKAQQNEQMAKLTRDLPMRRKQMERNYERSFGEDALADTYRRKLENRYQLPDDAYAADLYNAETLGLRQASADAGRRLFTNVSRTGGNVRAYQQTADALARDTNQAYAEASLKAKLLSRGAGRREADERDKNYANLYNLFATRASQLPDVGYKPENIDTQGTLSSSMAGDLNTGALATNMFAKKGGELDYTTANMGYGNAIAGLGSNIASTLRGIGARGGVSGFGGSGGSDDEMYTGGEGTFYSA